MTDRNKDAGKTASTLDRAAAEDRRARTRAPSESAATGLLEALLREPLRARASLERQLRAGADLQSTLNLLNAAEAVAEKRGLSIRALVGALRSRITRRGV